MYNRFIHSDLYICCQKYLIEDDGFCNEGVIVNSTGRLKELEEYFSTRQDNNTSPIHLIGLYTFVECLPDGDPVYKHTKSDVFLFKIPAYSPINEIIFHIIICQIIWFFCK